MFPQNLASSEKHRAECPDISEDADFLHYKIYADSVLFRLVKTVCDVTGLLTMVARCIFNIHIDITKLSVQKEMVSNRPMVHVRFRRLVILQTGVGLMKHVPETQADGARIDTIFSMTWPEVSLTVQNIERFSNLTFQFEYRKASDKRFFCMKGTVVGMTASAEAHPAELADAPLFLYLGSPITERKKYHPS
ncbi:hypothetical protein FJT64_009134 [Amphibalanus amphitrite]|uniref:guanylate cyclase n=1 Tax=Amphibalanus amphitrite TaxID=1232801 RepID=A0A6A4VEM2_AMPAM|nr:hypothetical protein FJT64_009134 [Amphibalanus amphitrite]